MQMFKEPHAAREPLQFGHPLLLLAILSWNKTSFSFR